MEFVDYYETMELDDSASQDDIKKAYRRLARKFHPDVSKEADSESRFKEIGEAYNVLKDTKKRKEYDHVRMHGNRQGDQFTPPPGWQRDSGYNPQGYEGMRQADFSEFFEQIFGSHARGQSTRHAEEQFNARGQDLHSKLVITLDNAFHGETLPFTFQAPVIHNDGSIRNEQKSLQVKIPKGVVNGQKIRLKGQGGPGVGNATAGDLYLDIDISDDKRFHLDGKDIISTLPITPWEAALGASIEVSTMDGNVNLTIPKNSKTDQKLRLKGRGIPGPTRGDQFVILKMVAPIPSTSEQKEIYVKMSSLWDFNPREASGN